MLEEELLEGGAGGVGGLLLVVCLLGGLLLALMGTVLAWRKAARFDQEIFITNITSPDLAGGLVAMRVCDGLESIQRRHTPHFQLAIIHAVK